MLQRARLVREDQRPRVVPCERYTGPLAAAEMTRLVILKARKFYIGQELMGALQMFRDDRLSSQRKAQKYVVENADPGEQSRLLGQISDSLGLTLN